LVVPLLTSGCFPPFWLFDDDDDDRPPMARPDETTQAPEGDTQAPSIVDIRIPQWPPLGAEAVVEVGVTDDFGLSQLEVVFANEFALSMSGTVYTASFTGLDLGEGFGTLSLTANDTSGWHATRWVENLLVDMTSPEITLGTTLVRADGEIEAWVADAWVLGSVTLEAGGATLFYDFDDGYPPTIGEAWHYALVKFPAADLEPGVTPAVMTVADAAGNVATASFTITVDGNAPSVQIASPTDGAVVSGPFQVNLAASDPEGGPTWIELKVSGTPAATAVGPDAIIQLDAAELAPGAHTLEAVATDQAGNASAPATISIQVP
jgi:hypothetical protein